MRFKTIQMVSSGSGLLHTHESQVYILITKITPLLQDTRLKVNVKTAAGVVELREIHTEATPTTSGQTLATMFPKTLLAAMHIGDSHQLFGPHSDHT